MAPLLDEGGGVFSKKQMSVQTEQFDADIEAVEPEMPVSFRIAEKEYTGQRTSIVDKQAMVDAGYEQAFDFLLLVRVALFTTAADLPKVNSDIEIYDVLRGTWITYTIASASPSQDGVAIQYALSANT